MNFYFAKRPALVLVLSFAFVIFLGTFLLSLPVSTPKNNPISFIDALFTATSATCVTGLIVRSTPQGFTTFGKIVILALIQIGGLGIMTFSIALILTLGKKISRSQENILLEALSEENIRSAKKLTNFLLIFTFGMEILGGIFLFFGFKNYFSTSSALKYAFFHSVSAFCNAGFSLFDESLMPFYSNFYILSIFSILIIFGGLGFVVLLDFYSHLKNATRLKVHTRIVLTTTFFLLLGGTVIFYIAEKNNLLSSMSNNVKWFNSFFASVTARTAGFNSLNTSNYSSLSKLLTMSLMFIGASPGGTGGGIKTVTFAIILLISLSHVKQKNEVTVFKRSIPEFFLMRAVTIFFYAVLLILISSGILYAIEPYPFEKILFEVFSAFGTVGLSTGITPHLSNTSKVVITILMFMGRLGPLTIALAAVKFKPEKISYASERIILG